MNKLSGDKKRFATAKLGICSQVKSPIIGSIGSEMDDILVRRKKKGLRGCSHIPLSP